MLYPLASLEDRGVNGGVLLADGRAFLIGPLAQQVLVWDPQADRILVRRRLSAAPWRVVVAPDGVTVYVVVGLQVAQMDERAEVLRTIELAEPSSRLALTGDGSRMVVGGGVATRVHLIDARTGDDVAAFGPVPGGVNEVAISADGATVAAACGRADLVKQVLNDTTVRVWDVASGRLRLEQSLPGKGNALAFSADGKRAVVGDDTGRVVVLDLERDVADGQFEGRSWTAFDATAPAHLNAIAGLRFLRDDTRLLSWSGSGRKHTGGRTGNSFALWDAASREELHRISRAEEVKAISLTADAATALVVGPGLAQVWRLPTD